MPAYFREQDKAGSFDAIGLVISLQNY